MKAQKGKETFSKSQSTESPLGHALRSAPGPKQKNASPPPPQTGPTVSQTELNLKHSKVSSRRGFGMPSWKEHVCWLRQLWIPTLALPPTSCVTRCSPLWASSSMRRG